MNRVLIILLVGGLIAFIFYLWVDGSRLPMDGRSKNISAKEMAYSPSLESLKRPLDEIEIISRNVLLKNSRYGMQTFDFDSQGNIYYSQLIGTKIDQDGYTKGGDTIYIIKSKPNGLAGQEYMTLQYFGHGGTLSVEESDGEIYVWVSSNATKHISGDRLTLNNYWGEKSISRIKFEKGKEYKGYGGETYFLNKGTFFVLIAAIDESGRYICFLGSKKNKNGGIDRYFYTYNFNEVKAAPTKEFEFEVRIGGQKNGEKERIVERKIVGHDLSKLEPLGSFSLPPGKDYSKDVNTYSNQGVEIDSLGDIYFFEGNQGSNKNRQQGAYVTVFDFSGKVRQDRTEVKAITDQRNLFFSGLTDETGEMEAEGIKKIGNSIYLGLSSSLRKNGRLYKGANIFKYEITDSNQMRK